MSDFAMPSLGADMAAATLVEWLVEPGARVKKGDVVAVVETEKGAIEIEIFEDGVIEDIAVPVGQKVPVGTVLARLSGAAEAPEPKPAPSAAPLPPPEPAARPPAEPVAPPPPPAPAAPVPPSAEAGRVRITPVARRRAAERGIDPSVLRGTGVDGAVTLADIEAVGATAPPPKAPPAAPRRAGFDAAAMRKAIAAAMSRSKREIPHYYLGQTVDVSRALAHLEAFNRERTPNERLLPAALFLKVVALALREVPQLNGFYENEAFRAADGIHIGWAISLRGGGLVAPALHDAADKTPVEIMASLRDLVKRARAGGLRSSELADATVTVTSLGDRGADTVIGVIHPPQVAIVGLGRIVSRPWVVEDRVEPRPVVDLTLAADHRASDGHLGGLLLAAIDRLLQEPDQL